MFCHKCGNKIADDAAFCHKCGTALHIDEVDPTAPVAEPREIAADDKVRYDVLLAEVGSNKAAAIKAVKESLGIGLKESKELVDNTPTLLKNSASEIEAKLIEQALCAVGCAVAVNKCSSDGYGEGEVKEGSIDTPPSSAVAKAENVGSQESMNLPQKSPSDNAHPEKNESENTQVPKPDDSRTFPLFGQVVTIPLDLANYNVFHCRYQNMTEKVLNEFPIEYKKNFSGIEQVLAGYLALCEKYLSSVIKAAVNDLIHNKVFDIDADAFLELHKKRMRGFSCYHAFEELEAKYENILDDQAEKNAYRTARRQNRGRWVGGGFGVGGAIKGAVQAGAFNAVGGIAHGTANVIGSAFSAVGTSVKKAALFNDSEILENLQFSLVYDCESVVFTLVEILKKRGYTIRAVNADEEKKAEAMFKNLYSSSFPASERLSTAIKVLLTNPYEIKYYHFLVDQFLDENREVDAFAQYFGLSVTAYKSFLVRKHYSTMAISTYEEVIAAKEKIIQQSKSLGGVPKDILEEIDALIDTRKIEKIRSLFKSLPKETLDQLLACRDKVNSCCKEIRPSDGGAKVLGEIDSLILKCKNSMVMKLFDSLPKTTEEEILESQKRLLEYCDEIKLAHDNPAVAKLNAAFQKIDKDLRTVEGIEFKTREEANAAKDEKANVEAIIAQHELVFRRDYVTLIDEITTQAYRTKISDIYIRQKQAALKKFDKKCRKAARYNYRKGKKLRIYSGDPKISLLHWSILLACFFSMAWGIGIILFPGYMLYLFLYSRRKEKKLWNELTHGGMYDFADIVSQGTGIQSKEEIVEAHKFCSECGSKLSSDARFCDSCGTAQND